jgi:hypothetical protein
MWQIKLTDDYEPHINEVILLHDHSPSWQANWSLSADGKVSEIFWNMNVHYCEMSGSYGEYEDDSLLRYSAV